MQPAFALIYDHVNHDWRKLDAPVFGNTNYRNKVTYMIIDSSLPLCAAKT
jgi:hypothetical protein